MKGDAGRGLGCQKTMDGKENKMNGQADKAIIPSCCLKARTSDPELEVNCHATVNSGWFSELRSCSGEAHSLQVEKILFKEKSEYQKVLVFESEQREMPYKQFYPREEAKRGIDPLKILKYSVDIHQRISNIPYCFEAKSARRFASNANYSSGSRSSIMWSGTARGHLFITHISSQQLWWRRVSMFEMARCLLVLQRELGLSYILELTEEGMT